MEQILSPLGHPSMHLSKYTLHLPSEGLFGSLYHYCLVENERILVFLIRRMLRIQLQHIYEVTKHKKELN